MKPLAPWHRPLIPHPSDRERRAMWWYRLILWLLLVIVTAAIWEWRP